MIGTVVATCIELFQSHEKARRWLKSPAVALGDCRPLDLLDTWVGSTMILHLLERIEHGVNS
jgi:putative toxin-antitoxin system antitoxin component (TIGR02293 family)